MPPQVNKPSTAAHNHEERVNAQPVTTNCTRTKRGIVRQSFRHRPHRGVVSGSASQAFGSNKRVSEGNAPQKNTSGSSIHFRQQHTLQAAARRIKNASINFSGQPTRGFLVPNYFCFYFIQNFFWENLGTKKPLGEIISNPH